MDDRALANAIIAGDQDAFRLLVERESGVVFRVCLRIVGQPHDAEDIVQDTFVIGHRSIGSWRGDGSLRAWLARIATREALRSRARRPIAVELLDTDDPGVHGRTGIPYGNADEEPLDALLSAERKRAIRAAVASLPDPYRETVALRFFAELTLEEVAAVTGHPLGTVKTHLHRGLRRLRDELAEGRLT